MLSITYTYYELLDLFADPASPSFKHFSLVLDEQVPLLSMLQKLSVPAAVSLSSVT